MSYSTRAIMARAWEIKRMNEDNIFGLCLKMAWAGVQLFGKNAILLSCAAIMDKNDEGLEARNYIKEAVKNEKDN